MTEMIYLHRNTKKSWQKIAYLIRFEDQARKEMLPGHSESLSGYWRYRVGKYRIISNQRKLMGKYTKKELAN